MGGHLFFIAGYAAFFFRTLVVTTCAKQTEVFGVIAAYVSSPLCFYGVTSGANPRYNRLMAVAVVLVAE
jgi:hypothetical protein